MSSTRESRAPAARRTRMSASSRASSCRTGRCSASSGISGMEDTRTAGSACFHLGCGLNRSRKDMGSLAIGSSSYRRSDSITSLSCSAIAFLYEPFGDLFAGHPMIVVQMHDHGGQRQTLLASLGTNLHHLVEAAEEALEMIGHQFSVLSRQVVHTLVDSPQRARPALLIEVAAEALVAVCRTGANEFRELPLFRLKPSRHR